MLQQNFKPEKNHKKIKARQNLPTKQILTTNKPNKFVHAECEATEETQQQQNK